MTLPAVGEFRDAVVGIDPGVHGAIAFIDTVDWFLGVVDIPLRPSVRHPEKNEPDPAAIAALLAAVNPMLVLSEEMHLRPDFKASPNTIMQLGRWRGQLEGVTSSLGLPLQEERPADWKRKMGTTAEKAMSRRRATTLIPQCAPLWKRVKDDGRAEAALLAFFGCLSLKRVPGYGVPIRLWSPKEQPNG